MPYLKTIILTLILSDLCTYYSDAQDHNLSQSSASGLLSSETNRLLGLDDLLVNGKRYIPANTKVTGSPEFEFKSGGNTRLYVKGQCFENAELALDIVSDHLILTQSHGNGLDDRIILHPAFVDSFTLGDHLFINPVNFREHFAERGYYEEIGGKSELLLRKYRKAYLKIYDSSNRGKYSPQRFSFYILDKNDMLIAVNSRKAFLKHYAVHKKAIRKYITSEHLAYRKAGNIELRNLMIYCHALFDEVY